LLRRDAAKNGWRPGAATNFMRAKARRPIMNSNEFQVNGWVP
jgi:hypothetical protein